MSEREVYSPHSLCVNDVINWFLNKSSLSPKKLQKMLYYAYAWGLVYLNEDIEHLDNKLFNETFEAWVHGPVIPKIYQKYKNYGFHDIPKSDESPSFPQEIEELLEDVWDVFGGCTANELEMMTHNELPWKEARGDSKPFDICHTALNDKTMYKFYLELSQSE